MGKSEAGGEEGYFRVSLQAARAIAAGSSDPEVLAALVVQRRFAFGLRRELTAAGAKKIGAALGITRRRAGKKLDSLLALRTGPRGETATVYTAAEWNQLTGQSVGTMRRNAPVYVFPDDEGLDAYLPAELVPPYEARSFLAPICEQAPRLALDVVQLLLLAYAATSYGDFLGADPDAFAAHAWSTEGESAGFRLGCFGSDQGRHYWLVREDDLPAVAPEAVTWLAWAGKHEQRFQSALAYCLGRGLVQRAAIVSDQGGRLLYPLTLYGDPHRALLAPFGIKGFGARWQQQARAAGLSVAEQLADVQMRGQSPGLSVCVTTDPEPPRIKTVFAPGYLARTPDNLTGLELAARQCQKWQNAHFQAVQAVQAFPV
jgi:hypothetical protein